MFFILGIQDEVRELAFDQTVVCPVCGRFGHLRVTVACTVLSLFFLPVLRWGRRYAVRLSCCGAGCDLDARLGRDIERGRVTQLDPDGLPLSGGRPGRKRCRQCGFETGEDFAFCPRCGTKF